MNAEQDRREPPLRRILVSLEEWEGARAALQAAAGLAASLRLELAAVLIERQALLDLAELPFAREVSRSGAESRRLTSGGLQRSLRRQAEEMRREIERIAASSQLQWSFTTLRIKGGGEVLRLCEAGDILAPAGTLPPEVPPQAALLLQGRRRQPLGPGPVVWLEGKSVKEPPALALRLAKALERPLHSLPRPQNQRERFRLLEGLRRTGSALLLLADDPETHDLPFAKTLAEEAPCPVLLLGREQAEIGDQPSR